MWYHLVKIVLLFESICSMCGVKARFCCSSCGKPICGRCMSKEKKALIDNIVVPSGLCRYCVENRKEEHSHGNLNPLSEAVTIYVTEPTEIIRINEDL